MLSRTIKADTEQGLSSEMFAFSVQYFSLDARNPTAEAKAVLKQITTAGVRAYLSERFYSFRLSLCGVVGYNITRTFCA